MPGGSHRPGISRAGRTGARRPDLARRAHRRGASVLLAAAARRLAAGAGAAAALGAGALALGAAVLAARLAALAGGLRAARLPGGRGRRFGGTRRRGTTRCHSLLLWLHASSAAHDFRRPPAHTRQTRRGACRFPLWLRVGIALPLAILGFGEWACSRLRARAAPCRQLPHCRERAVASCRRRARTGVGRHRRMRPGPELPVAGYFQAARARARTCITGACGCTTGAACDAEAGGHVTCSKCASMPSPRKRVRPAYTWRSPPPDCCVT